MLVGGLDEVSKRKVEKKYKPGEVSLVRCSTQVA
jgi:hypothetical protein